MIKFLILFFFGVSAFAQVNNGATSNITNAPGLSSSKNYVKNPNCAKNTDGITGSGGSLTKGTTTPLNEDSGSECAIDASASGQTYTWALNTFGQGMKGQNCEARFIYEGDASLYKAYIKNGSSQITTNLQLENSSSVVKTVSINFPCGDLSASNTFVIEATDNAAAAISVAKVYVGLATNLSNVAQAQLIGSAYYASTASCSWARTNTALGAFSTTAACPGPTVETNTGPGTIQTTDTDLPQLTINNLPPGNYSVTATFPASSGTTSTECVLALNDGTSTSGNSTVGNGSASGYRFPATVVGTFSYTTTANRTFSVYGSCDTGSINIPIDTANKRLYFSVTRHPSSAELALNIRNPASPTVQVFTSGSGTYTRPNGVKYITVKMVGGGGGASGSGSAATGAGGNGGDTTWDVSGGGANILTAGGGLGAVSNSLVGALGGTATVNSPAVKLVGLQGGAGGSGMNSNASALYLPGGVGGASCFGGTGNSAAGSSTVTAAPTNAGGGGGGAGIDAAASKYAGSGGGAGACVEAIIVSPSSTYSYAVGAAGTAGTGSDRNGGAGGSGYIVVTEYYDSGNAPLLVGSVTSNSSGLVRTEYATVTPSDGSTCTINSQSGSWLSSTTPNAAGDCTLTIATGIFSSSPVCTLTPEDSANLGVVPKFARVHSVSSTSLRFLVEQIDETSAFASSITAQPLKTHIICMGSR